MLFLKSWLQDYIDLTDITDRELEVRVTNFAMEVEEVRRVRDYFDGKVVLGRVENPQPVSGSDKLKSFKVNIGNRHIHLLSAAPNVRDQMIIPVALVGAKLPHGLSISERKMMGELSQGMGCGKSELGLEEGFSDGLWDIVGIFESETEAIDSNTRSDFPITCTSAKFQELCDGILGKMVCDVFPELFPEQILFDIKVLPDKMGTANNYFGMAYEIALAFQNLDLLTQKTKEYLDFDLLIAQSEASITDLTDSNYLTFEDKLGYSRYYSLHRVKFGDEVVLPVEIARRMYLTGQNSVSPIVDISNYLLHDIGQPTHFFSTAKVAAIDPGDSKHLVLDQISDSTQFSGLGQLKETRLPAGTATIQLLEQNIILPGISGGQTTMVDTQETDLLLELACFDRGLVARNSFGLGYRSDGARVFAGGVPSSKLLLCLIRLKELLGTDIDIQILWLSANQAGTTALNWSTFGSILRAEAAAPVILDLSYLNQRWEKGSHRDDIISALQLLGQVEVMNDDQQVAFIPQRLTVEVDSIEGLIGEVARLTGLNSILPEPLQSVVAHRLDTIYKPLQLLRQFVTTLGFTESINRPFISQDVLHQLSLQSSDGLRIVNPIRSQEPYCRTGLVESLLGVVRRNLEAGYSDMSLFELNKVYLPIASQVIGRSKAIPKSNVHEKLLLGIISTVGQIQTLTTSMNRILAQLYQPQVKFQNFENQLTRNGYLATNEQIEVQIMQLSNLIKKKFGIPLTKNVYYLEFNLTNWDHRINQFSVYREDREFPDLKRSLSMFVPANVWFNDVQQKIQEVIANAQPAWEVLVEGVERLTNTPDATETSILNLNLKFNNPTATITGIEADTAELLILESLQDLSPEIKRR